MALLRTKEQYLTIIIKKKIVNWISRLPPEKAEQTTLSAGEREEKPAGVGVGVARTR